MSMVACFAALDRETLAKLEANPDSIEDFLYPKNTEGVPPHYMDVDKAWHGIHFVLTGQAEGGPEPLSFAILGGQEFGDDVGYGPARFLTPEQVRLVATALASFGELRFKAGFAPKAMAQAGVYPQAVWVRDGDDALDYLLTSYQRISTFYRAAAARGDCVVLWIS